MEIIESREIIGYEPMRYTIFRIDPDGKRFNITTCICESDAYRGVAELKAYSVNGAQYAYELNPKYNN